MAPPNQSPTPVPPARPLAQDYIDLVKRIARQQHGPACPLLVDDLIQEGSVGLLRAIRTYDPAKGPFEPFAIRLVRFDICRAIGRAAGKSVSAGYLDTEEAVGHESDTVHRDNISDQMQSNELLAQLPARLQRVARLHYGLQGFRQLSFEQIGRRMHLTRQRVEQLHKEALWWLYQAAQGRADVVICDKDIANIQKRRQLAPDPEVIKALVLFITQVPVDLSKLLEALEGVRRENRELRRESAEKDQAADLLHDIAAAGQMTTDHKEHYLSLFPDVGR